MIRSFINTKYLDQIVKKLYYLSLFVIFSMLIILVFEEEIIIPVSAETFESIDNDNYLFLEIEDDKANGVIKIGVKIITIQTDVKFYKNNSFKIKVLNDNIFLFGSIDTLKVKILELNDRKKIIIDIQKLDTTPYIKTTEKELTSLEKYYYAQEQTGLIHIETQKRLEEEQRKIEKEAARIAEEKAYLPYG